MTKSARLIEKMATFQESNMYSVQVESVDVAAALLLAREISGEFVGQGANGKFWFNSKAGADEFTAKMKEAELKYDKPVKNTGASDKIHFE